MRVPVRRRADAGDCTAIPPQREARDAAAGPLAQGTVWRWVGWASWRVSPLALVLAAAALVVDLTTAWLGVPHVVLGVAVLSPAVPLGLLLVVAVGPRSVGLSARPPRTCVSSSRREPSSSRWPCAAYIAHVGPWSHPAGLLVAGLGEELVYRIAAILLFGAATAALLGRDWRDTGRWGTAPVLVSLLVSAVVFSVLPGHVEQMAGPAQYVPFASLALILGYTMMRTGSVLPGVLVHVLLDVVALAHLHGAISDASRLALSSVLLVALVVATMVAGRRSGLRRAAPRVIDLRRLEHGVLAPPVP